jgi:hypothetical protein
MTKASDFKLAQHLIRLFCKQHGCGFVDVYVVFDQGQPRYENGKIVIAGLQKWGQTIFQIVAAYVTNFEQITGIVTDINQEETNQFLTTCLALIRDFTYSENSFPEAQPPRPTITRLNRQPFVWLVLRDIIVPVFQMPLRNVKIGVLKGPDVDAARLLEPSEAFQNNVDWPMLVLNLEVENQAVRTAQLLYEAIRAHDLDPQVVGRRLLSDESLRQQFSGLVKIAMESRDNVNNFLTFFSMLCEYEGVEELLEMQKTAGWNGKQGIWSQAQYDPSGWWYLGLIEKSLEQARGPDWSGYYTMKPFTDELWRKIDNEKKRRGLATLPMEALLRVQSEEYQQRSDLTIQGLLADNRVW